MLWNESSKKLLAGTILISVTILMSLAHGIRFEVGSTTIFSASLTLGALVSIGLIYSVFARVRFWRILNALAVPTGIYVSALFLTIGSLHEATHLIGSALIAPLIGGVIFFASIDQVEDETVSLPLGHWSIIPISLIVIAVPFFVIQWFADLSWTYQPLDQIHSVICFSAFYFIQKGDLNRIDRLVNAGCYNFLFQSGYLVFLYVETVFSFEASNRPFDPFFIGVITSDLVLPLFLYLITLLVALRSRRIAGISVKNWHLVEGYLFLIAMVVAPPSIIEKILGS